MEKLSNLETNLGSFEILAVAQNSVASFSQAAEDLRARRICANFGELLQGAVVRPTKRGKVAVINISGTLIRTGGSWWSETTAYDDIREVLDEVEADPEFESAEFVINSGGGQGAGMFETIARIKSFSKPIVAKIESSACSAAYALACACDEIVALPHSMVGSIGVIAVYYKTVEAMKRWGVEVFPIVCPKGSDKALGAPFSSFDAKELAKLQSLMDGYYAFFANFVSERRNLTRNTVDNFNASVYLAKEAFELGLIDRIEENAMADKKQTVPAVKETLLYESNSVQPEAAAPKAQPEAAVRGEVVKLLGALSVKGYSGEQSLKVLTLWANSCGDIEAACSLANRLGLLAQAPAASGAFAGQGAKQFAEAVAGSTVQLNSNPAPVVELDSQSARNAEFIKNTSRAE